MKLLAGRPGKRLRTALIPAPRHAVKSALQQSQICGLRGWDSPIPPTPANQNRGASPAGRRRRHTVAVRAGHSLRCSWAVMTQDQKQGAERQMKVLSRLTAIAVAALFASSGAAFAGLGQPTPWQLGLQDAASPVMQQIISFHNYVLVIVTLITIFVLALLVYIVVRFNARANPTPSRTTHNTLLEVLWTIVPVVILVFIAIPSFKLLFTELDVPTPDLTIKATGKQWYWSYAYPDNGNFEFDSLM